MSFVERSASQNGRKHNQLPQSHMRDTTIASECIDTAVLLQSASRGPSFILVQSSAALMLRFLGKKVHAGRMTAKKFASTEG